MMWTGVILGQTVQPSIGEGETRVGSALDVNRGEPGETASDADILVLGLRNEKQAATTGARNISLAMRHVTVYS